MQGSLRRARKNPSLNCLLPLRAWHTILEVISSPQPDPQRPNLLAPKVKEQHQHDTSGHAGEIESATGVEMMHISQSLSCPVAAYRASVFGLPRELCTPMAVEPPAVCYPGLAGGTLREANA
jgi:hypothetical protein